ncbi:hypothetical protein GF357_01410 [Candidatus Dojkabacteria bacterium]|nr:hypothetical protein [Candidatus Dojkabacteria bacterium]
MDSTEKKGNLLVIVALVAGILIASAVSFYIGLAMGKNETSGEVNTNIPAGENPGEENLRGTQEEIDMNATIKAIKHEYLDIQTIPDDKKVYYVKNGDVWAADVSNLSKVSETKVIDETQEIEKIAYSESLDMIAYLTSSLSDDASQQGNPLFANDTVMLYDTANQSTKKIFEVKDSKVWSMAFIDDSREVVISGTDVWIYNIDDGALEEYDIGLEGNFCPTAGIESISPTGDNIILSKACYEGSESSIFDLQEGKTLYSFGDIHLEGDIAAGFVGNDVVLGLSRTSEDAVEFEEVFYLTDLTGAKLKEFNELDASTDKIWFNEDGSLYIVVIDDEIQIYRVDSQTNDLIDETYKFADKEMLVEYVKDEQSWTRALSVINLGTGEEYELLKKD